MRFCGECGNPTVDGARFCGNCGAPVSPEHHSHPTPALTDTSEQYLETMSPRGGGDSIRPSAADEPAELTPFPAQPVPDEPLGSGTQASGPDEGVTDRPAEQVDAVDPILRTQYRPVAAPPAAPPMPATPTPAATGDEVCAQCGAALETDAVFCGECGSRVSVVESTPESPAITCSQCGAELVAGDQFCDSCGARVASHTTASRTCPTCGQHWPES